MRIAKLVALQVLVFTAAGWTLSAVLDLAGALTLTNALFLAGLLLAVIAGLVALESSNVPIAPNFRAGTAMSMTGLSDRLDLGVPMSRAQAFAVVSAAISAGGLVAAAIVVA